MLLGILHDDTELGSPRPFPGCHHVAGDAHHRFLAVPNQGRSKGDLPPKMEMVNR